MAELPRILIVDDEPPVREVLEQMLAPSALSVATADSVQSALQELRENTFDVVITDLAMPGERGIALARYAAQHHMDPAVIIISGYPDLEDAMTAVHLHASDFLVKPFRREVIQGSVKRAFADLQRRRAQMNGDALTDSEQARLETLVAALDACEHDTCAHSLRVREYSFHLAQLVDYPVQELAQLGQAALLHDIGKISIPSVVLWKPARLDADEFELMKTHVARGAAILERLPTLRSAVPIILHHHENFDGSGYPHGIRGRQIPLGARIFALVDTLDAMTSDRCYRKALSIEAAYAEVRRCSGKQFDPAIAEAFLRVEPAYWTMLRERANADASSGWEALCAALRTPLPQTLPALQGAGEWRILVESGQPEAGSRG